MWCKAAGLWLAAVVCLGWGLGCDAPEESGKGDTIQDGEGEEDLGRESLDGIHEIRGYSDVAASDTTTPADQITQQKTEIPLKPTDQFLQRKASYLQSCSDESGPDSGKLYGQVCRMATQQVTYDEARIDEGLTEIGNREDTSDFTATLFVRMLYMDRLAPVLPDALRDRIEEGMLGFKYWLSEPGKDQMCYWTENHQILFHSTELLMGQLYPDTLFGNSGMTGRQHVEHATPLIHRWLDFRGRIGFSEWHSNVYFNEDFPALLNLAEFAEEEEIRTKAQMVVDVLLVDILANSYKGFFATTHGRTYSNKYLNGLKDSTEAVVWVAAGAGSTQDFGNFSAAFLVTGEGYVPSSVVEQWAGDVAAMSEHRQRDSLNVEEAGEWGLGYEGHDDIIFWAGSGSILGPTVAPGFLAFLNEFDLWDGFLVGGIEEPYKGMLQQMSTNPAAVKNFAMELLPVSQGLGLEQVNTYTYRTPDYQLSGAQDYKPGFWSAQTMPWIAALDGTAAVTSMLPANPKMLGGEFGDAWIGGWTPRVTLHRSVGVIQYRTVEVKLFGEAFNTELSHAYFPGKAFDEVVEKTPWICGRKGQGYLCLASRYPTTWNTGNEYELKVESHENTWVVQMGRQADCGSFAEFVEAVTQSTLSFDDETVLFVSPVEGTVEVAWEGPMTVDGAEVALGPYQRMDGPGVQQGWGEETLRVQSGSLELELDFGKVSRRVWESP